MFDMFGWFKSKPKDKENDKWALQVHEAVEKYGSAKLALDEFAKDMCEKNIGIQDPLVCLMLIERKEKLDFEKSIKDGK